MDLTDPKPIPLRPALRVEMVYIIICIIRSEYFNLMVKGFAIERWNFWEIQGETFSYQTR